LKAAFAGVLLACGLWLFASCAQAPLDGCGKDDDCAEGRICEAGTCVWAEGGPSSTSCVETGEPCSINADCCNFQNEAGFCVSGTCADACSEGVGCESECCALLTSNHFACAPASICEEACVVTGDPCSINSDCCSYRQGSGFCVDGFCADECSQEAPDECESFCCAELSSGDFACAPPELCGI
jgi:hypothetical protein